MAITAETNNLRKSNAMNLPYGDSWDGLGFRLKPTFVPSNPFADVFVFFLNNSRPIHW